jgi:hypothetical protein
MARNITLAERETGLTWDDEEKIVTIWTTSPRWLRYFSKQFGPGVPKGTACHEWKVQLQQIGIRRRRKSDPATRTQAQRAATAKASQRLASLRNQTRSPGKLQPQPSET